MEMSLSEGRLERRQPVTKVETSDQWSLVGSGQVYLVMRTIEISVLIFKNIYFSTFVN